MSGTVTRRALLAGASGVVLSACSLQDSSGSDYDLLRDRFSPGSRRVVDHSAWDRLLQAHVFPRSDDVHLFEYGTVTGAEREELDRYIRALTNTPVHTLDRREQYAFWLNLYNALVVRLILSRYLVLS